MNGVVRSMTGFAVEEGALEGGGRYVLTIKGVNHRFLDLVFRLPHGCEALEMELRGMVKGRVERGHVEVSLEVLRPEEGSRTRVDAERFRAVVEELREAMEGAGLDGTVEATALLRVPGVLVTERRGSRAGLEELQTAVRDGAGRALDGFGVFRQREGEELGRELGAGMERILTLLERVAEARGEVRSTQMARLRRRMGELLAGAAVSEERLLTEAGLLAERSDVEEELVRLRTHVERFREMLQEGGAVGKRMDFLLQEFSREANTILAKSGAAAGERGVEMVGVGLEMKAEIERAREQVQNLE